MVAEVIDLAKEPQPGDFRFIECDVCPLGSGKPMRHRGRHKLW